MKKKIRTWKVLVNIVIVLLVLWGLLSIIDTNIHNSPFSDSYKNYQSWNLFEILFN